MLRQTPLSNIAEDATPAVNYAVKNFGSNWAAWLRKQYVENSDLPADLWDEIRGAVVKIAKEELVVDEILERRGLTQSGGSVATQISKWPTVGEFDQATQAMNPNSGTPNQDLNPSVNIVPLPYTFADFQMNIREMESGQQGGFSLDTTQAEAASRVVMEKIEESHLNGGDVSVNVSGTVAQAEGLTNFSGRVTDTHTDWTGAGDPKDSIITMLGLVPDRFENRPMGLLVSSKYSAILEDDYKVESDRTVRGRLMDIEQIEELEVCPTLDPGELVLFALSSDVIDKREIEPVQVVNWDINPFATQFKALTVNTIRLKPQPDGSNTGIVHSTE